MTVKAYHYVPASAMEKLLHQREILPSSERVDPSIFMWDCQNTMNEIRAEIESEGLIGDENALEALYDWMEQELHSLEEWQRQVGPEETHRETQFMCMDLLAGDLDRVFLSIGDWVHWAPQEDPSGFVFDAEELIRDGAGIRASDLSLPYMDALKRVLTKRWKLRENAREVLETELHAVMKANTLHKNDALKWLRAAGPSIARTARHEGGRAELVWEGSLPLKLATEVWSEGRRVAV